MLARIRRRESARIEPGWLVMTSPDSKLFDEEVTGIVTRVSAVTAAGKELNPDGAAVNDLRFDILDVDTGDVRACVRAVRACVRAVRACVRACVHQISIPTPRPRLATTPTHTHPPTRAPASSTRRQQAVHACYRARQCPAYWCCGVRSFIHLRRHVNFTARRCPLHILQWAVSSPQVVPQATVDDLSYFEGNRQHKDGLVDGQQDCDLFVKRMCDADEIFALQQVSVVLRRVRTGTSTGSVCSDDGCLVLLATRSRTPSVRSGASIHSFIHSFIVNRPMPQRPSLHTDAQLSLCCDRSTPDWILTH